MSEKRFTHLHVHSEYSLLDGSAKIKELISRAKELGMDSIALTDHGVMYGVINFYKEAVENGVKPILGCEVYVATGSRFSKESKEDSYYHLVLLAENDEGYHNLIKLVSAGFTEGFYYKPRVDVELLREHHNGLIALSACLAGPVAKFVINSTYEKALEQATLYDEIFGRGNFYLELQNHGLRDQQLVNKQLIRMSKETGIPLVCTNDIHYINREDSKAHDILLCIQTNKTVNDEERMKYEGDQFYLKSPEEMNELFSYVPQALENTALIAERCELNIEFNKYKLPLFQLPEDYEDAYTYLRTLCYEGLAVRYGEVTQELQDRLEYELSVINSMGFVDYFLIVWDFIKYAKDHSIMVGPGRGSSGGSLVIYSLGITNIDPIRNNLFFERFLNPERISMPDIDIDFCYERRQEVIDYVIQKYGADHVAQIITFGTMAARGAIRDVGRALGMSYADVDRIAKMIPFELGITISRALELNPELMKAYKEEDDTQNLIDMSRRLEGLPRHASTHAAGIVICNVPVTEYVPLNMNDGVITTQFPMNTLEELGLLKMDFLGLRTLTVIQNAVKEIERNHNISIDIDHIDFKNEKVYELISQGKTEGLFQLESSGMKSFMRELQPGCLDDVRDGISLYRPGPMEFIPRYVAVKNGGAAARYTHESLKPILESTHGCIVYQEQVMQIVRDLAGYSIGRSDLVRRAMSKKKMSVMEQERRNFIYGMDDVIPGCVKNGIPEEAANKIFDEMIDFAKYAFPKPHAVAYAIVGYQTGWLKYYYPVEFMAATMTSVMDSSAKVAEYINECKKMNIQLLPPDINEGYGHFSVGGGIRFGLLAIKNVGRGTVESLVRERNANGPFKSMTDFINRMESKDLNKRCMESLIKAGAFDSMGGRRAQYMVAYKNILDGAVRSRKNNVQGQMSLFDFGGDEQAMITDELPGVNEFHPRELLNYEKEVLGIYLSGHPFSQYENAVRRYVNTTSMDFMIREESDLGTGDIPASVGHMAGNNSPALMFDGKQISYGGLIANKTVKYTKNNQAMAFLTVEDLYGTVEVIVFAQAYEKYMYRLDVESVIVVNGRASVREDEDTKIICNDIMFYEDMDVEPDKTLYLKIPQELNVEPGDLTGILAAHKGKIPVVVYDEKKSKKMRMNQMYWVNPGERLLDRLKEFLGNESVVLKETK